MTNTTELRKRFEDTKFAKGGGSCFECCDYEAMLEDQWAFLQSEIEQAEQARTEEIIKVFEDYLLQDVSPVFDHKAFISLCRSKFLTKHDDERT